VNWFERLKPRFRRGTERGGPPKLDGGAETPRTFGGEHRAAKGDEAATFPRFRSTAGDQPDRSASDGLSLAWLNLRRAYTPSQPITDREMFAGRKAIVTKVIRAIEDERLHAIIHGQRGIGKTSLLHVLAQAAREARYLVVYVPCGATASFDEIFRAVASAIPVRFHEDYGPTSPEAERGASLANLLPATEVSPRLASDLCAKVVGTRALVVLDEFDRSESMDFRRNVAEFLKNLSDRSVRVQLVIAGVAGNLEELIEPGAMIQRAVVGIAVPRMTPEELAELVRKGQAVCGITFAPDAVETLVSAANGLPYLASLLSRHAGMLALAQGSLSVVAADVHAAVAEALMEMKARAHRRTLIEIAKCERDGSHLFLGRLSGLAQVGNGGFSNAGINALFPGNAARVRELVARLAADGVLVEAHEDEFGNQYRFPDQNILPYLWLLATQARMEGRDPFAAPAIPRAQAEAH
jgi:Cdc6-like AAA superfamily ATPase